MPDNPSRRGAANLGVLIMIVAFVAMAVFLYWLNVQSQKQKAVEIREDSAAAAANNPDTTGIGGATTVALSDLQTNAGQFEGKLVRVAGLKVASQLGKEGFWVGLPGGSPFLVALSDSLRQAGVTVPTGQSVTVAGTMEAMTDSVQNAWMQAGTITKDDQTAAGFAQFYIEAQQVVQTGEGGGS